MIARQSGLIGSGPRSLQKEESSTPLRVLELVKHLRSTSHAAIPGSRTGRRDAITDMHDSDTGGPGCRRGDSLHYKGQSRVHRAAKGSDESQGRRRGDRQTCHYKMGLRFKSYKI